MDYIHLYFKMIYTENTILKQNCAGATNSLLEGTQSSQMTDQKKNLV